MADKLAQASEDFNRASAQRWLAHPATGLPHAVAVVSRCAYDRCQAGGVILPGAPRVLFTEGPFGKPHVMTMHPGCDEARRRAELVKA